MLRFKYDVIFGLIYWYDPIKISRKEKRRDYYFSKVKRNRKEGEKWMDAIKRIKNK